MSWERTGPKVKYLIVRVVVALAVLYFLCEFPFSALEVVYQNY